MADNMCALLREVQHQAFVMQEAKLFLDTHPGDAKAMRAFCMAKEKEEAARAAYTAYLPLVAADSAGDENWGWGCTPWPWEV